MGRGLIAEPYWVEKVKNNEIETLRRCISCNIGCADHRIAKSKPIRCTVNPDIISYEDYKRYQVTKPLNIVVIGGGSAGLEAAATAAEVGCNVTLYEEKSFLGGLSTIISRFPYKRRIADLPKFLINRITKLTNVKVHLNTKATPEIVANHNPDLVVAATGAKALLPPIKGLHEELSKKDRKVFSIFDLMDNFEHFTNIPDKKIVVIGGGAVGLDVIEYFSENKAKSSTIVEMQSALAKDLDVIGRLSMMKMIDDNKVNVKLGTTLQEVKSDRFIVSKNDQQEALEFDYGFICLGLTPITQFIDELRTHADKNNYLFQQIGDSKQARKLIDGMREARDIIALIQSIERTKSHEIRGVDINKPL